MDLEPTEQYVFGVVCLAPTSNADSTDDTFAIRCVSTGSSLHGPGLILLKSSNLHMIREFLLQTDLIWKFLKVESVATGMACFPPMLTLRSPACDSVTDYISDTNIPFPPRHSILCPYTLIWPCHGVHRKACRQEDNSLSRRRRTHHIHHYLRQGPARGSQAKCQSQRRNVLADVAHIRECSSR